MKAKFVLVLMVVCTCCFTGLLLAFADADLKNEFAVSGTSSSEKVGPTITIADYLSFSKENSSRKIERVVTTLPDSYIAFVFNVADSRVKNYDAPLSSTTDESGNTTYLTPKEEYAAYRDSFGPIFRTLLVENFPRSIRDFELELEQVVEEKVKGEDAFVHVKLRSVNNSYHCENQFFFLHKENGNWRIYFVSEFKTDEGFPY